MTADQLVRIAREGLYLALTISAPVVVACLAAGLVVGLLQAATQVQDATIGLAPRLAAAGIGLALAGPWIGAQLVRFTRSVLDALPLVS